MKVAVTGASGFIGRHVMHELAARGVDVLVTTRSADRLSDWRDRVHVIELDIASPGARELESLAGADALIHLAWEGLPNYQSRHHFEVELPRQYGFLKAVVERGAPALVVAGTCAEYGPQSGELAEECPTSPFSPYGFAKDSLRRELEFLRRDQPFALTWVRLFYMYGEGQSSRSLYPQLAAAALRGDQAFDMSGGDQLRDYLPVTEVARWLVELAVRRLDAGIVNVCAGEAISVRELAEGFIRRHGWDLRLNLGRYPYPEGEPMAFWGSRRKLERLCARS